MTLHQRIKDLHQRVVRLAEARCQYQEVQQLQARLDEAQAAASPLAQFAMRSRLLRQYGVPLAAPLAAAATLRTRILTLRGRFGAQPVAATLTKGKYWQQLLDGTDALVKEAKATLDAAWRTHVDNLYTGERPDQLAATLAPTDLNKKALERYRKTYADLIRWKGVLPTEPADFEQVRFLAQSLKAIHAEFDFNVPPSVKRFLEAVAQDGAALDLLTEEVRAWLQQSGTSDRYHIVARR